MTPITRLSEGERGQGRGAEQQPGSERARVLALDGDRHWSRSIFSNRIE